MAFDTFTRGDSTNLGVDWVELIGDVTLVDNRVDNVSIIPLECVAHWAADEPSADMYVQAHLVKNGVAIDHSTSMGLFLRKDGTATQTYWLFDLAFDAAGVNQNMVAIYSCTAGVYAGPLASATVTLTQNQTYLLRAEALGQNLRLLLDGVERLTYVIPGAPLTGQRGGIRCFASHAGSASWLDFGADEFVDQGSSTGASGYRPAFKPRRGR